MTFKRSHIRFKLLRVSTLASVAVFLTASASFGVDEVALGNQNYLKGDYAAAKLHYQKAIAARAERWEAHYQLANTCLQLKDKEGAKKGYKRCLSLNPSPDIRAHCLRAVSFLAGLPMAPTLAPIPAPTPAPTPEAQEQLPSYLSPTETTPIKTDAELQKEASRERIMRDAEAEIVKMKEEENSRYRDIVSQSNRVFRSDGTYRRGLTSEGMEQFLKEVAAKEQAIRDRAKRNCDAIR